MRNIKRGKKDTQENRAGRKEQEADTENFGPSEREGPLRRIRMREKYDLDFNTSKNFIG